MATKQSLPQQPAAGVKPKKKKRTLPRNVVARNGKWYVVVRYREGGERHATWVECEKNATHAAEVRDALKEKLKKHGTASLRNRERTWGELAKYYKDEYLIEAVYIDDKKAEGRRVLKNPLSQLRLLTTLIGEPTKLRNMDYEFWRRIRRALIARPTRSTKKEPRGHQRSMVDVNRHMGLGRHMFKVARNGLHWIQHDPFADAMEPLITPADEKKRRRVMSFEEEEMLLTNCIGRRAHLRLVIIGLADTLTRSESEFFKLRVGDLDFASQRINVQQLNTKLLKARGAPISRRFAEEARRWIASENLSASDRLFPYNSIKTAWRTLKRNAGVTDLRIKDLRRTAATRLLRAGHPMGEISQLLGHADVGMTYEYFGIDKQTTGRAVEVLDAMHEAREQKETVH